jgi:hypothetical protein
MKFIINKTLLCESLHDLAVNSAKFGGTIDANSVAEQALNMKGLNPKTNQEISEKKQLDELRASKSGISSKDAIMAKNEMKLQGHG